MRLQAPHSDDLAEIARRGGAAFESVAPPVDPYRPRGPLFGAGELEREGERRAPARMDTTRARYALDGLLAEPDAYGDPDDDLPW